MKMKKNKKFDKLLHQYIDVEHSKKQKYLNVFYQIYNESDTANVSLDVDFKQKLKSISSENKKSISFSPILRYAAVVALVLVVSIIASMRFLDKKISNNEFLALDTTTYKYQKLILTYQNSSDNHSKQNITLTAQSSNIVENNNDYNTQSTNYIAETNIEPLEMKKSIIPIQQNIDCSPELIDTRTIYQGLQNIAAILEQEEIAQANNNHKNQIIINTWNNIKKFIGEGELPDNISLASAYNFIKNTANKQE